MDELTEIRPLSWDEVFGIWRAAEANLPRWIEHYRARGFKTWDEWRFEDVKAFEPGKLAWKLYTLRNPAELIPRFRGGAFRSWIKNVYPACPSFRFHADERPYPSDELPPFSEIVAVARVQKSDLVQSIMANPPTATTLIGLDTGKGIVILEGMHRACAFTLARAQQKNIPTAISIALADFHGKRVPVGGQAGSPAA